MKIAMIGAGAMGCLYGGRFSAAAENEVILLDVWQEHVDAVNQQELLMEENGVFQTYGRIKAETDASKAGPCDLAVIFVKSAMTRQAVEDNRAVFGEKTIALTLQNGLGNIDQIGEVIGKANIIAGTSAHGATMLGPGRMRHAGKGKTVIGELDGRKTERVQQIGGLLEKAGLEPDISDNVLGLVWDKLLVNVGINALTGITRLHNGKLLEHPEITEILESAVAEGAAVARAIGIRLSFADPAAHTREVCTATAGNKASMLQDIENHRQTEIDMINGAIVREGARAGIATPVNQVLTNLIKFLQK